jgi:hypothetical protein
MGVVVGNVLAFDVTPTVEKVSVPLAIATISLLSVIAGAAVTSVLGRWAEATNRRRQAYASAVEALVAWTEYPYRIRRRTSDSREELSRLANIGHDLQERLRCHQTWVSAESRRVGAQYRDALAHVSAHVGPACVDAWNTAPIQTAADMNLGGWGPSAQCGPVVDSLQTAITWRFGWRRIVAFGLGLTRRHPK